jgi:hypothetical protein
MKPVRLLEMNESSGGGVRPYRGAGKGSDWTKYQPAASIGSISPASIRSPMPRQGWAGWWRLKPILIGRDGPADSTRCWNVWEIVSVSHNIDYRSFTV